MKRPTLVAFVLLLAAGVALLVAARHGHQATAGTAAAAPSSTRSGALAHDRSAENAGAAQPVDLDERVVAATREAPDEANADAGGVLSDGGAVPDLEAETPKSVVFGVVLVQYAEAQGAPPGTRSRAEAEKLAGELGTLAKTDFKAAVEKGDPGSTINAGKMFRGVLEPAPEYVLFTLASGTVAPEPVDTPRGYWLLRRR